MAIYELTTENLVPVSPTTFGVEGVKERADLQRLLGRHIGAVAPDTMVIAEEFGQWQDSKRRIDLLCLDKEGNLVVVELKRTEDGGHMELQAVRYAAMVSAMTFEQVVAAREAFQRKNNIEGDAEETILAFLGLDEPDEDEFAQDVRIVLVSSDFSKELTTAVMWLNTHDLDVRCVRLKPYSFEGRVLIDVQQVIPLPEAAEYQVQIKEKAQKEKKARKWNVDFTRYDVTINGECHKGLWKRRAILLVVKALVARGVSPDEIGNAVEWRKRNMWWRIEGDVSAALFEEKAMEKGLLGGRSFDPKRWFCDADDLIPWNGDTYAFSNQWGKQWPDAMDRLVAKCPELGIRFVPTENDGVESAG